MVPFLCRVQKPQRTKVCCNILWLHEPQVPPSTAGRVGVTVPTIQTGSSGLDRSCPWPWWTWSLCAPLHMLMGPQPQVCPHCSQTVLLSLSPMSLNLPVSSWRPASLKSSIPVPTCPGFKSWPCHALTTLSLRSFTWELGVEPLLYILSRGFNRIIQSA